MNERKMILSMLNEGKITLEEADELLAALEFSQVSNEEVKEVKEVSAQEEKQTKKENYEISEDDFESYIDSLEDIEDDVEDLEDDLEDAIDALDDQIDGIDDQIEDLAEEGEGEEIISKLEAQKETLKEKKEELKKKMNDVKDYQKEMKHKMKERRHEISFDLQEGLDEIKRGFQEVKKNLNLDENMKDLKATMRNVVDEINEGMKEAKAGIEEGTREVRKSFKGNDFSQLFKNIVRQFGFYPQKTIEEEIIGEFSSDSVTVDLQTKNGRIEVYGTDETNKYKLKLIYKIRANDHEADDLIKEMATLTQEPNLLRLETKTMIPGSVSVQLHIPKKLAADYQFKTSNGRIIMKDIKTDKNLLLKSSNGRIMLNGVRSDEMKINTSNGRVEVKDFAVSKGNIHTSNGSIYLDGLFDEIVARTSNGTITAYPNVTEKGNFDARTSNGRIKVIVLNKEIGLDLDTVSSHGSVTLDLPDLVYQKKIEKHMRREYQAQTKDYIGREKRLQVQASTSNGSIYVGNLEE